jgi:DNA-binding transcriptional LysR family regulator
MKRTDQPTLNQLKMLLVVARAGSLGAAARELGFSQQTVSQAARELERRCELHLFDRDFDRTYLTSWGKRVALQAKTVLDEYERLLEMIRKMVHREALEDRRWKRKLEEQS